MHLLAEVYRDEETEYKLIDTRVLSLKQMKTGVVKAPAQGLLNKRHAHFGSINKT